MLPATAAHPASEDRLRRMFTGAGIGIAITDMDGVFIDTNPAFSDAVGYSVEELLSLSFPELTHSQDRRRVAEAVQALRQGTTTSQVVETRATARDGSTRHLRSSLTLLRDDDGTPTHVMGTIEDVTEARRTDRHLERSRRLLRMAGSIAGFGGWQLDLRSGELIWSDEIIELLGYSPDVRPTLDDAIQMMLPEYRAAARDAFVSCLRDGTMFDLEMEVRTASGERRWVRILGEADHDELGRVRSFRGAMQDIDDGKRAEEERRRLEQHVLRIQRMESLGSLTSGLAHDLGNALALVTMGVDMLANGETDPQRQLTFEVVERSARRSAEMLQKLLLFVRGRTEDHHEAVDMGELVSELGHLVTATFPRSITFRNEVPTELWTVLGDPTQLHQVLVNLCVNARDAMPSGGEVTVTASNVVTDLPRETPRGRVTAGAHVQLTVTDTGDGMTPDEVAAALEPFATTKGSTGGSGLGLPTARSIVERHGGVLVVDSAPGQGTTVRIHLPAVAEAVAA